MRRMLLAMAIVSLIRSFFMAMDMVYAVSESEMFLVQGCEQRTFVLTAYYSPLPGQEFYYKGNEYDDKVLNGQGIRGASGKKVFNGMLAAPSTYAFGGKVYIPGRGWGEIADRGGAIVEAGNRGRDHDRLDMRVGAGEEGLVRGLTFGVKTLDAWYCPEDVTMTYNDGSAASMGFDRTQIPIYKHFFLLTLFVQELYEGRNDMRVATLQEQLVKLGYLQNDAVNAMFDTNTKQAVCNFQIKEKILSADSKRCGHFGPSTRNALQTRLRVAKLFPINSRESGTMSHILSQAKGEVSMDVGLCQGAASGKLSETFQGRLGGVSYDVCVLQKKLQILGYDIPRIDGRMDQNTRTMVQQFQEDHQFVESTGKITKQTITVLNKINIEILAQANNHVW